jgi:hypothetical protein
MSESVVVAVVSEDESELSSSTWLRMWYIDCRTGIGSGWRTGASSTSRRFGGGSEKWASASGDTGLMSIHAMHVNSGFTHFDTRSWAQASEDPRCTRGEEHRCRTVADYQRVLGRGSLAGEYRDRHWECRTWSSSTGWVKNCPLSSS